MQCRSQTHNDTIFVAQRGGTVRDDVFAARWVTKTDGTRRSCRFGTHGRHGEEASSRPPLPAHCPGFASRPSKALQISLAWKNGTAHSTGFS